MRALIVCGSPRRDGCTGSMCAGLAEGLAEGGFGSAETLRPAEMDIGFSEGEDDMAEVFSAFREADLFVLATPVYFNGPSALIKSVVDRFDPYWHNGGEHPRYMACMICGGSPEPNFRNTESIFRSLCNTVGSEWLGALEIGGSDHADNVAFFVRAKEFGKMLAHSVSR